MTYGPPKLYETVLIVPISNELKEKFANKVGKRKMAEIVRQLIKNYVEKE